MPLLLHASVLLLLLLLHVLLLHLQLHMLLLILLLLVLLLLMLPLQVLLLLLLLLLLLMHVLLHVLLQVMPHVLPLVLPVRSKIPRSIVVGQMTAHTHRCRIRATMQCPHGGMCSVVPRLIGNGYKIRQITNWCCQESGSIYQAYGPVPMITSDTDICYNAECSNGSICPLWTGQVSGPLAKRGALSLILLSGPTPF